MINKIKEFFKIFNIFSKRYLAFVFVIILSICIVHNILVFISYKSHKNALEQKYLSYASLTANSMEILLDNIFHQAEFYGKRINDNFNENSINKLLKNNFSFDTNLDTLRLIHWIKFNFISAKNPNFYDNHLSVLSKNNPWTLNFDSLEIIDHKSYLPINFGITNNNQKFIGSLYARIDIDSVIKYLQKNFQEKNIGIVILDNNQNIIAQSNDKIDIPLKFFREINFKDNFGKISKEYEANDRVFVAFAKLSTYPFTIIISENNSIILEPFKYNFRRYLFGFFFAIVSISIILSFFYKILIVPINNLFNLTNAILKNENINDFTKDIKHPFTEIKKLYEALLKVNEYRCDLANSNLELQKSKQQLQDQNHKLHLAFEIRDEFQKQQLTSTDFNPNDIIQKCLDMLYPEIYSREIIIINKISDLDIVNISQGDFIKIIENILSRSFIFCKKNDEVELSNNFCEINSYQYISIIIKDSGFGNEEFRKSILKNSCTINQTTSLIEQNQGIIRIIDEECGIKYCILLPSKPIKSKKEDNNIIHMFPNKK